MKCRKNLGPKVFSLLKTGIFCFVVIEVTLCFWKCNNCNINLEEKVSDDYNALTDTKPYNANSRKKILLWESDYYDPPDLRLGLGYEIFREAQCEYQNCETVTDWLSLPATSWDAVIFLAYPKDLDVLQAYFTERDEKQLMVYMEKESPKIHPSFSEEWEDFFNITVTYRSDSDIPMPYGWFSSNKELTPWTVDSISFNGTEKKPYTGRDWLKNRKKMIAWFVSNCEAPSKRNDYVEELQKYVEVDVVGKCGNKECVPKQAMKCYKILAARYKFYLSFENSICTDYITEKVFNIMKLNIIPIVLGGANYTKILPPHSYIDVNDFESVKDLANYVEKVGNDTELYNEYFWWKKHYYVKSGSQHVLCEICKMINENYRKEAYHRVSDWYHREDACNDERQYWMKKDDYSKKDKDFYKNGFINMLKALLKTNGIDYTT